MDRVAEPELMDSPDQAAAYANADFSAPHDAFVQHFRDRFGDFYGAEVLDLGCGPADVTVRFARAHPDCAVTAVDGARAMLIHAADAIARAGLTTRIRLLHAYLPQQLPAEKRYAAVISNSLLHHLRDPLDMWRMVRRTAADDAPVLVMDLMRPTSYEACRALVSCYAADAAPVLGRDFYHSLRAAYTVEEVQAQLAATGLDGLRVEAVSDRHLIVHGRCHV